MASIINKLTHHNQTGVAAPYTQQQLLAQQGQVIGSPILGQPTFGQNQVIGSPILGQPTFGGSNILTEQQLVGQQQQFTLQKNALLVNEPATTTTLQPIVQQSIRQDRVVEVQPIIHRDIERPVVNHIERHITEPAPVSRAGAVQHGAIVEERVHNRVVNEIQPVIHREIAVPQVEQVQQHFVERVVATPQHTRQVVYEQIPAVQGQQYIQQGLGTQQYLQTGLVQRSALLATQQPGFLGTQQGGIPLQYNQQTSLLNQQPLIGYGTGVGGYGTGVGGYGTGLTKAQLKEEKHFDRNLRREQKHIEREQNQITRHQLRQYETMQKEQALLERHQLLQAQRGNQGLLGGSPLSLGGLGGINANRGIYTADPYSSSLYGQQYGQQYISQQPIYGTGLNQGFGTGLGGQQFLNQGFQQPIYGTGLNQGFGTGLVGQQQFLNQPYGSEFNQGLNQGFGTGLVGQQQPFLGQQQPFLGQQQGFQHQHGEHESKALRYEQKAAEYEREGNQAKALRNREKAARLRQQL